MKTLFAIAFFVLISFFFNSCLKDSKLEKYTYYVPVYALKSDVRANIKSSGAQSISTPGKIFVQGNYIYLNEGGKGIHIIDYSVPSSPKNMAFIPIPGNGNVTIHGNYLYADEYSDLLTIDITNPLQAKLVNIVPNVFPENSYGYYDTVHILTSWRRVDTMVKNSDPIMRPYPVEYYLATVPSAQAQSSTAGVGGSMAQFAVLKDRLYTVSLHNLNVFNVKQSAQPLFVQSINTNQSATETIYPLGNNLFIGGGNGMFIYNATNADNPRLIGTFGHATACDPVIADASTAYVTLHSGDFCGDMNNELDVLNSSDVTNPTLIKSYSFTNPRGLAKDGDKLFVCDGQDGLKILNAANANNITVTKVVSGFEANDVIAGNGIAIVVATNGLYFITYSSLYNASIVSKL